jgi:hypothetical protein
MYTHNEPIVETIAPNNRINIIAHDIIVLNDSNREDNKNQIKKNIKKSFKLFLFILFLSVVITCAEITMAIVGTIFINKYDYNYIKSCKRYETSKAILKMAIAFTSINYLLVVFTILFDVVILIYLLTTIKVKHKDYFEGVVIWSLLVLHGIAIIGSTILCSISLHNSNIKLEGCKEMEEFVNTLYGVYIIIFVGVPALSTIVAIVAFISMFIKDVERKCILLYNRVINWYANRITA